MPFAFATTHVRHDQAFLAKWLDHYGAIVGRENLFVTLDGDDWEPEADLDGVEVEVLTGTPDRRVAHDRFIADHMSNRVQHLRRRGRYDHAIRTDVDEYVVLDPAAGTDWETALSDHVERGYVYALGVDIVQRDDDATPLDLSRPVLSQRFHGLLSSFYSKPFATSRWAVWSGGAHRLQNREVAIDPRFVMIHLANCDADLARARMQARGGAALHKSFTRHVETRQAEADEIAAARAAPFDDLRALAVSEFSRTPEGAPVKRPRKSDHPDAVQNGFATVLPERMRDLV